MIPPMRGNSSHSICPDCPNCLNSWVGPKQTRFSLELRDLLSLGERLGHGLAVHRGKLGLVVKGLEMRRSTCLVQEDDAFRLGWKIERIHHASRLTIRSLCSPKQS